MNDKLTILNKVLEGFAEKSHPTDPTSKELIEDFRAIAKAIICGGYILVTSGNKSHRIYIDVLEFYFHNETDNGIKDFTMYHRNKVANANQDKNSNTKLEYYHIGEINMHMSGFDITFENKEKKIRASALIRAYRCVPNGMKWDDIKQPEYRSTYLYNHFLKGMSIFDGISIKWIDEASDNRKLNPDSYPRKNIKHYDSDGKKDEKKPCDRKWRYALDGIKIQ